MNKVFVFKVLLLRFILGVWEYRVGKVNSGVGSKVKVVFFIGIYVIIGILGGNEVRGF